MVATPNSVFTKFVFLVRHPVAISVVTQTIFILYLNIKHTWYHKHQTSCFKLSSISHDPSSSCNYQIIKLMSSSGNFKILHQQSLNKMQRSSITPSKHKEKIHKACVTWQAIIFARRFLAKPINQAYTV